MRLVICVAIVVGSIAVFVSNETVAAGDSCIEITSQSTLADKVRIRGALESDAAIKAVVEKCLLGQLTIEVTDMHVHSAEYAFSETSMLKYFVPDAAIGVIDSHVKNPSECGASVGQNANMLVEDPCHLMIERFSVVERPNHTLAWLRRFKGSATQITSTYAYFHGVQCSLHYLKSADQIAFSYLTMSFYNFVFGHELELYSNQRNAIPSALDCISTLTRAAAGK